MTLNCHVASVMLSVKTGLGSLSNLAVVELEVEAAPGCAFLSCSCNNCNIISHDGVLAGVCQSQPGDWHCRGVGGAITICQD